MTVEDQPTPRDIKELRRRFPAGLVAAGAAVGLMLAGIGVAAAQTDPSTSPTTEAPAPATPVPEGTEPGPRPDRPARTPVTGEAAEKVSAAALAAVPGGEVLGVHTGREAGTYKADVRKADGTVLSVKVNANFEVTGVNECGPGGPRGPRGTLPEQAPTDAATT